MNYLLSAVICSVLISTLMRFSKQKTDEPVAVFLMNYIVCSVLAKLYIGDAAVFSFSGVSAFSMVLGFWEAFHFSAVF